MRSFFFIPAENKKFLKKASLVSATDIVIDFEDALGWSSLDLALENLNSIKIDSTWWARIPGNFSDENLYTLNEKGFSRFLLAKIEFSQEIDDFFQRVSPFFEEKLEIMVLCESPMALVNLKEIVSHSKVSGLGFGSHDYCREIGMQHDLDNINWARKSLLNYSKAYSKFIIDIASMNLNDKQAFIEECRDGKNLGFDGKFLIHPWQLDLFLKHWKFNDQDLEFALKVKHHVEGIGGLQNFTVAKIDGTIVELPHLNKINSILKSNNYGGL